MSVTLYMIPGTATDWRIFLTQAEKIPALKVPAWLAPLNKKESIADYARRFADTIDTSSPFILCGLSLGGMIAQEMATVTKPICVILISSCSDSKELSFMARMSGKLGRLLPDWWMKCQLGWMADAVKKAGRLKYRKEYETMLREVSPPLARWQSGAATEWTLSKALTMPVYHLHGSKDKVIPLSNVGQVAVIIDGGHLINITHAAQVNDYIQECVNKSAA